LNLPSFLTPLLFNKYLLSTHFTQPTKDIHPALPLLSTHFKVGISSHHLIFLTTFFKLQPSPYFCSLTDITAADFPHFLARRRFRLTYVLQSFSSFHRLLLVLFSSQTVPSVSSVFPSANWLEREAYDLFGILFANHPDLRRLLVDYSFKGFPLRKSFPVSGYFQLRYSEELRRILSEHLNLVQSSRFYEKKKRFS
jgi:NADH:ubiquinone oxidoreductase subunit C